MQSLGSKSFLDYMELSGEYAIAEFTAPKSWIGKSLKELNVRSKYQLSVLAIRNEGSGKLRMSPGGDDPVSKGDAILVMGRQTDLKRLQRL